MKHTSIAMLGFIMGAISFTVPAVLSLLSGSLSPYVAIVFTLMNVGGWAMFWYQISMAEAKPK